MSKNTKFSSSSSIREQWSNVDEPLKDKTYLRKKLFYNSLGVNFLTSKSGIRLEKQSVLGPAYWKC